MIDWVLIKSSVPANELNIRTSSTSAKSSSSQLAQRTHLIRSSSSTETTPSSSSRSSHHQNSNQHPGQHIPKGKFSFSLKYKQGRFDASIMPCLFQAHVAAGEQRHLFDPALQPFCGNPHLTGWLNFWPCVTIKLGK